jgi:hypothetical protein
MRLIDKIASRSVNLTTDSSYYNYAFFCGIDYYMLQKIKEVSFHPALRVQYYEERHSRSYLDHWQNTINPVLNLRIRVVRTT